MILLSSQRISKVIMGQAGKISKMKPYFLEMCPLFYRLVFVWLGRVEFLSCQEFKVHQSHFHISSGGKIHTACYMQTGIWQNE
jgi:hypothetical protein